MTRDDAAAAIHAAQSRFCKWPLVEFASLPETLKDMYRAMADPFEFSAFADRHRRAAEADVISAAVRYLRWRRVGTADEEQDAAQLLQDAVAALRALAGMASTSSDADNP